MKVSKTSVSIPEDIYREALKRAKGMGYDSFSKYLTFLIKKDLEDRKTHTETITIVREEPRDTYKPSKGK